MFDKVKKILENYTESEIKEDSSLVGDLGLSSIDIVSIVADFEDEFNIKIEDKDIFNFLNVDDILKYFEEKCR
jgi:acyl carrier protein